MADKQVQIRKGTTAQNDSFTGALGEMSFDTQQNRLRLHNGSTAGGFPHALKSEVDAVTPPFADTQTVIKGSGDPTKLLRFEVDGFTAATTRVLTPQNADYTIAGTNVANNFSATQLYTPDNTSDIGASGANRPRDIFAGRNGTFGGWVNAIGLGTLGFIISTATSTFEWASRTKIGCNSTDGQLLVSNAAVTDFGRIMFGGTTASFPALKRSATGLHARLADDSAFTFFAANVFQTMTALVALGGGATPTFGTIGGSGPATAAQNTWLRMLDSTGAAFWVPAWK